MGYFNRQRANSVVIPDAPLNNLKICSGVAEMILNGQFDEDISWYRQLFDTFLITYYKKDSLNLDDVLDKYAVNTNNKSHSPNSIATLIRAEELEGELGAAVQNAIIFSIAMSIVTESKTTGMKDLIYAMSMTRGAEDTKTNEEHRANMLAMHPRAAAIAEAIGHLESKKVAHNVVSMMGYLVDKGDIGVDETEQQKVTRIFDEQKIGA